MFFIQSFLEKSLNRWVYRKLVFLQPFEFWTGLADIPYKVSKPGHVTPGFTLPILSCPSVLRSSPPTPKENAWKEPFRKDSAASVTQERPPLFTQVVRLGGKDGLDEIICKYIKYQGKKPVLGRNPPWHSEVHPPWVLLWGTWSWGHMDDSRKDSAKGRLLWRFSHWAPLNILWCPGQLCELDTRFKIFSSLHGCFAFILFLGS